MNNLSAERLLRCGEDQWAATLLQAALELGVFTELGRGPRTCAQLQRRLALRGPGAADLLDALVGLGWLDREGDDPEAVYVNAREASHYLDARSPASLAGWLGDAFMIATLAAASLVCALRGEPWTPWPLPVAALDVWAGLVGRALAQRIELDSARTVFASGGGAVHTACALADGLEALQVIVQVARPELAPARDHIGAHGLAARVQAQAHDGVTPVDAVVVNRWWSAAGDPDAALQPARTALRTGGRLLWVDHWLDDSRRHSAPALVAVLRRRLAGDAPRADRVRDGRERCLAAGFTRTGHAVLTGGLSVLQASV